MPELRPPISRLDWALVSLLQRVQRDVVKPLIDRWCSIIVDDEVESARADDRLALAQNIICALKVRRGRGRPPPEQTINSLDTIDLAIKDFIRKELRDTNVDLFNSYYFVAIDSYGDEGQYYFFPVAPGVTSFPGMDVTNELEKFHTYLEQLGLPFVLRSRRRGDYSGVLLPGQAGVTPQVCIEARSNGSIDPQVVPLFLNDLAILGKAEDAVQQHLSAVIVPLIQPSGTEWLCRGAFLLTSSVPDAFADWMVRDEKPWTQLKRIITDWTRGPIESLHGVARAESPDAHVDFRDPPYAGAASLRGRLDHQAKSWLARLTPKGAAALRFDHGGENGAMRAVNQDSLTMALRSHLCPSPLLAPSCYIRQDRVIPAALRKIVVALGNLREIEKQNEVHSDILSALFTDSLCNVAALVRIGDSSEVPLSGLIAHHSEICALALHRQDIDEAARRELVLRLKAICAGIYVERKDAPLLPGERPPIYAKLESRHHWATHLGSVDESDDPAAEAYDMIAAMLKQDGVFGVLVFEKARLFIPSDDEASGGVVVKDKHSRILDRLNEADNTLWGRVEGALMNPASFWLYEQILQALTTKSFPVEKVAEGTEYYNPAYFRITQPTFYPRSVVLSTSPMDNGAFASAMNYLGIPVKEWKNHDDSDVHPSDIRIERPIHVCIAKVWKDYLKTTLKEAHRNQAIRRAARGSDNNDEGIKILSVEKTGAADAELKVFYSATNVGTEGTRHGYAFMTWKPFDTLRLEFVGMNVVSLIQSVRRPIADSEVDPGAQLRLVQAWHPRPGWTDVELDPDYVDRLHHLLAEFRRRSEGERTFRVAHEGRSLHQAVHDVEVALHRYEEVRSADNDSGAAAPAPGDPRDEAFASLEKAVNDMIDERAMQEMECRPREPAIGFLARLGAGPAVGDIDRLARFTRAQALRAADLLLRETAHPGLERASWDPLLKELTGSCKESWQLEDRRIVDRSSADAIERSNYRILLIAKVLANVYKHSVLDLVRAISPDPVKPVTPEDCPRPMMDIYRECFRIRFDQSTIETESSLFSTPGPDKQGTKQVLNSYLRSRVWAQEGEVSSWEPVNPSGPGRARFRVALTLPEDFWHSAQT